MKTSYMILSRNHDTAHPVSLAVMFKTDTAMAIFGWNQTAQAWIQKRDLLRYWMGDDGALDGDQATRAQAWDAARTLGTTLDAAKSAFTAAVRAETASV